VSITSGERFAQAGGAPMIVKPSTKAELSDAQVETLTKVAARGSDTAVRFADTKTVKTLTALATRGHVALQWGPVDGRARGIHSAKVTGAGERVLAREIARRDQLAAYEAHMARAIGQAAAPVVALDEPALTIETGAAGTVAVVTASRSIVARMDPFEVIRTGNRAEVEIPF
jgi:hypothetical protein